jgi:hypothetical protein
MNQQEFINICVDKKFWQWIRNKSLISYENISDQRVFLKDLFEKIANRTYYPNPPKEYLTINKGNGVLRVVPVLSLSDLLVFFYCVRKLEPYIAINRIPGTYGGFGLSGKLRKTEEDEKEGISNGLKVIKLGKDVYVFEESNGYPVQSSFNSKAWQAEWGDFNNKLYHHSFNFNDGVVVELDISNFYDSIQLDNLEFKIRKYISNEENQVVYLLLHFLRFWNRHINFYRQQGAGVPQDLFGECSRILANFYLQDYDQNISAFCNDLGCQYFRYADDQIIFINDSSNPEKIISKASSLLMKEGLNFNQMKVNTMSIDQFRMYYSFSSFFELAFERDNISNDDIIRKIENQIDFYLKNRMILRKSGLSLLKRILGLLNKYKVLPKNLDILKQAILNYDFFHKSHFSSIDLNKIYRLLNEAERKKMIEILDVLINGSYYTFFLHDIKKFYQEICFSTVIIDKRIEELKDFYYFCTVR